MCIFKWRNEFGCICPYCRTPINEAQAEETTEELFDGVESTEATLVDASDENDEIEATRASVAEWLENNVLSK